MDHFGRPRGGRRSNRLGHVALTLHDRSRAELQRLVLAAVDPYVDRTALAQQIDREEQQRRALADFIGRWDAAGGTSERPF